MTAMAELPGLWAPASPPAAAAARMPPVRIPPARVSPAGASRARVSPARVSPARLPSVPAAPAARRPVPLPSDPLRSDPVSSDLVRSDPVSSDPGLPVPVPPGREAGARAPEPREPGPRLVGSDAGRPGPARPASPRRPVRSAPGGSRPGVRSDTPRRSVPTPAAPPSRGALGLLRQAAAGLAEAHREDDPLLRYPAAYLAALRAAAAVLAVRAEPGPRRAATRNVWQLLARVAPEWGEWATFFASCSDTRAAAEAGIHRLVPRRDADDLLHQAEQFVTLVGSTLPLR